MAIVQVSRITHRKGLSENLPQLAGAEFGWVIDQRRLFIGNGTLQEGAPAIGNTEILTQYSDVIALADTYSYKGEAGGYVVQTGPTSGDPITRSLQAKLDDFASVRDFGATGDGNTDDTVAINRALFQLFCRETNSAVRRSLFFPAGIYLVSDSINIPPFARIYGEGADSTIILLSASAGGSYAGRTADSLQQTGAGIGSNGATTPRNIEISSITFQTAKVTDAFFVEDAANVRFENVGFVGPYARTDLGTVAAEISCVAFESSASATTNNIVFDACRFSNMSYAFEVDQQVQGVTVTNSKFEVFYQAILLGTGTVIDGGPVGFKITQNLFDTIAREGIIIGDVSNNMTGYNIFLDVGTNFYGGDQAPVSSIIDIQQDNNVSVGDMFERGEGQNAVVPRIDINNKRVFALDKGERYKFGTYVRQAGEIETIAITGSLTTIVTVNINQTEAFNMKYTFKDSGNAVVRHGTLSVVAAEDPGDSTGSLTYMDDFIENNTSGLILSVDQSGNVISVQYTSSAAGNFTYSINHLG